MPTLVYAKLAFAITILVAIIAVILVPTPTLFSSFALYENSAQGKLTATDQAAASLTSTDTTMASIRRAAPLVFPAVSRHTATVIFIHGLGDSGAGWADAVQLWQKQRKLDEVKFVLPNAPVTPITMNQGYPMPAWFDLISLPGSGSSTNILDREEDETGILRSRDYFHSLIQDEISNGIAADRIVIGGFSQGGAMGLLSGLTAPVKIGGIVGLSCWLLLAKKFKDLVPKENLNKETPIFMGHGDLDPMVRYPWAQATEQLLKGLNYDVTLKTYRGMEHSACLEELGDVEAFLQARLPAKGNV